MKSIRALFTASIVGTLAVWACSTPVAGGGSETNWLACADGGVCATGYLCDYTNRCMPLASTTGTAQAGASRAPLTAGTYTTFMELLGTFMDPSMSRGERCLPIVLPVVPDGTTPCVVLDVSTDSPTCASAGQSRPSGLEVESATQYFRDAGLCGTSSTPSCDQLYTCEVQQLTGDGGDGCRSANPPSSLAGWCYIDPAQGLGDPTLTAGCSASQQRIVQWLMPNEPGHTYLINCNAEKPHASVSPGLGSVGAPCTPLDEQRSDFAGFDENAVSVELGAPECASDRCLVNHFRGRASCPYGQIDSSGACRTTGPQSDPVTVPVQPQFSRRQPDDAVYCSCRCAGPESDGQYCTCPLGFECSDLLPPFQTQFPGVTGSYCVKSGTEVNDPQNLPTTAAPPCDPAVGNCGTPPGGR